MKREFLKELGIADDVLDKIMVENGKDIESLKTQVEKDKNAISALTTERDGLKTQLADANKQIDGFRDLDIEGVKKQADEWKASTATVVQRRFNNLRRRIKKDVFLKNLTAPQNF